MIYTPTVEKRDEQKGWLTLWTMHTYICTFTLFTYPLKRDDEIGRLGHFGLWTSDPRFFWVHNQRTRDPGHKICSWMRRIYSVNNNYLASEIIIIKPIKKNANRNFRTTKCISNYSSYISYYHTLTRYGLQYYDEIGRLGHFGLWTSRTHDSPEYITIQ